MKASRIVRLKQFFILYAVVFSTNLIFPVTIFSQSVNKVEIYSKVHQYLKKGKQIEALFPDSAVYYYQKGLEFLNDDQSLSLIKVDLLTRIGAIFHQQSKYSFAFDYYLKALDEAQSINNDSLIAEGYFNIAEVFLENGSYAKAVESYYNAKELFEKINYKDGIFWSDIGLGIIYRKLGNTELSKKHYELAKSIGEQTDSKYYVAVSYNNMGNLYKQIGEYETALNYLQLALKSFEEYGKESFVSDCLEGIGEVYSEMGNYKRAVDYFKKSMRIAETTDDKYRLLSRYANIAKSYSNLNNNKSALIYFSKTIGLAQAVGDKSRLSDIYIMISDFYKKNDNPDKALLNLKKSLLISKEIGDTVSFASALNSLSELYFLKEDYKSGYDYALQAYQVSSKKDLMKTLAKSSLSLSKILELWGNFKDALFYFKIHKKTSDFLLNSKKMKIVEDAEAKYNVERIEKEKLKLENAALRGKEKLQRRNTLITILIIVLFLLFIGSGLYLRKRRDEKNEISEKSLRMKRKIDLLNSQLNEKNRELTSKALLISQNNEVLREVVQSIESYLQDQNKDKNVLKRLKMRLQEIYEEKSWDDFIQHFEQVHPQFYKNLLNRSGDLTSAEQKICAFLKMNLNTKEISYITNQSTKAIEVMRSRIRKKLGIPHEESLTKTIQSI